MSSKIKLPHRRLIFYKFLSLFFGDFHIAEEITQDAFLKAYKELATLKKPHHFARWLSVIATRGCIAWLRKKRLSTQSLEDTSHAQLEKA